MKRKRFKVEKIIEILKAHEAGQSVEELCRVYGMSSASFYSWRKKYGGMEVGDAVRLKALQDENTRLKQLVADLSLDNQMLKAINAKKW